MKKKIIPVVLLLVIGIVAGLYYGHGRDRGAGMVLRGEVEGTTYSQFAEVTGKVVEMNLELGGPVNAGDLIVRLDDTDLRFTLEQLQITLEKQRLAHRNLQRGAKEEELEKARSDISIAEANYRSAEAVFNQARDEMEPLTILLEADGISQNELDKAKLKETTAAEALEVAKGQIDKANEQLALLQRGTDWETIAMAATDIEGTESKIRQMEDNLSKYEITANCDGIVISKNYNLGSMVNPGYNLADISADNERYVVCYVPKDESLLISYGQTFTVRSGEEECLGEVRFIDVKSQYTPKDMQTTATRNKISVKVKLLLPADTDLKPGSQVEVVIP